MRHFNHSEFYHAKTEMVHWRMLTSYTISTRTPNSRCTRETKQISAGVPSFAPRNAESTAIVLVAGDPKFGQAGYRVSHGAARCFGVQCNVTDRAQPSSFTLTAICSHGLTSWITHIGINPRSRHFGALVCTDGMCARESELERL
jgi:hypothetical protein